MSSGKIKKIKFFFEDADCVFFVVLLENIRVAGARAHFMRLDILLSSFQFNSFHFYSFLFYSIQRDENNETLRMITKENEKKRKVSKHYEILRKKGKMLLKHHDNVIFYIKTVYFFIHVKNENIAFPFFFFCFVFFVFIRYL